MASKLVVALFSVWFTIGVAATAAHAGKGCGGGGTAAACGEAAAASGCGGDGAAAAEMGGCGQAKVACANCSGPEKCPNQENCPHADCACKRGAEGETPEADEAE